MKQQNIVSAYAWQCDFGLCGWAEPTKHQLEGRRSERKPSPEAKAVRVKIMTLAEYKRLKLKAQLA